MDNYIKTIINGLKTWVANRLNHLEENLGKKINATNSTANEANSTANEANRTVGYIRSNMVSKRDPVVDGSFSQNRSPGSTIGNYSHAEGYSTTASGNRSHAEGYYTTASGDYSHAEGKFNIEDTTGKYAHIVGNGQTIKMRSNVHTLDWAGVPWYRSRPQFGGNAQDDGSQTVMANGDKRITLKSPDGKLYGITVSNDGTLTTTEVTT